MIEERLEALEKIVASLQKEIARLKGEDDSAEDCDTIFLDLGDNEYIDDALH